MEKTEKKWIDNTEETSIADTLFEYVRYWKWFILSIIACLIIGAIVILVTQKEYKSSLSILLNEDKSSSSKSSADFNLESLGLLATTNNIENEIAILSSPDLMYLVVDSMNLKTSYYINNWLRKTEIYSEAPFSVKYKSPVNDLFENIEFYIQKTESGFNVYGEYASSAEKIKIDQNVASIPALVKIADNIELDIALTGKKIDDSEKYYVTIANPIAVVTSLCSRLIVSPTSKTSSVLNIGLLVNNSERGSAVLRELIKQYNALNVKTNNEMAYNTAVFINERLKEISIELGDAEEEVVEYKQQNSITDLSTEAQTYVQQTGLNDQKLLDIETQINILSMIERFVNNPNNNLKVIPNLGISDASLSQTINEYNNKILNSDALLKATGDENPTRKRIQEEINNTRNSISHSLSNVKQAYNVSRNDLLKQSYSTQSKIKLVPKQEKGLIEKVRQQSIKESLFLFLMQKREENNLSIASYADKARIIVSPQQNLLPVAPKSKIILLVALLLGFLVPVIVIYTLNLFRTQIRNRKELEKLSDVSILGEISKNLTKEQIVIEENQNTGISEMFRLLRNNVNFLLKNSENKTVLLTSTISGEGKSFISVNLAVSFALMGKKILLVGADLRNPKLMDYLNISAKKGLSDYLVGDDDSWQEYVNKFGVHTNFDCIISGTIPPNPNELLMSPRLKKFISETKEVYDIVIIDTAPVGLVSDTYLIDEYIDVTLYVVRENVTPKAAISFINTQKEEGKLKNMYLVFNDSGQNNNYRYGYGKAYGYEHK